MGWWGLLDETLFGGRRWTLACSCCSAQCRGSAGLCRPLSLIVIQCWLEPVYASAPCPACAESQAKSSLPVKSWRCATTCVMTNGTRACCLIKHLGTRVPEVQGSSPTKLRCSCQETESEAIRGWAPRGEPSDRRGDPRLRNSSRGMATREPAAEPMRMRGLTARKPVKNLGTCTRKKKHEVGMSVRCCCRCT